MQNPDFKGVLDDAMRELGGGGGGAPSGDGTGAAGRIFSALSSGGGGGAAPEGGGSGGDGDPEATLMKTLEMLQGLAAESSGSGGGGGASSTTAAGATEAMAEDVIARMAAEFERMGAAEDFDPAVTGMMKQLLSRDLMYLPMKQITDAVGGGAGWCRIDGGGLHVEPSFRGRLT